MLNHLRDTIPPNVDLYKGDITRDIQSQINKARRWKRKARSDAYKKQAEDQEKKIQEELNMTNKDPTNKVTKNDITKKVKVIKTLSFGIGHIKD